MTRFFKEKQCIIEFYSALDSASETEIPAALSRFCSPDYKWFGYHPFNELTSPVTVAEVFWMPLRRALKSMQRRMDIFMAGHNAMDGGKSIWAVSMGHLMGLFDEPWLGISPTGKIALLRYCEFNRVEDGQIAESAMFFDIPHLMAQAGLHPFPLQTAAHLVQPGPLTHDGLMFEDADPAESAKTQAAIDRMIDDLQKWQNEIPIQDELRRSWNEDMIWWGPEGIGATYTIERYAKQHAGPFRAGFGEREFVGHIAKISEGHYGGFFGWPNLRLKPRGGFMGMPATDKTGEMRVIDIYRRAGDKLAENWIFIDLLHFWYEQGLDILGRNQTLSSE